MASFSASSFLQDVFLKETWKTKHTSLISCESPVFLGSHYVNHIAVPQNLPGSRHFVRWWVTWWTFSQPSDRFASFISKFFSHPTNYAMFCNLVKTMSFSSHSSQFTNLHWPDFFFFLITDPKSKATSGSFFTHAINFLKFWSLAIHERFSQRLLT